MVTVREALLQGTKYLKSGDRPLPRLDAEVLLSHLLGSSRGQLYRDLPQELTEQQLLAYMDLLARCRSGEPIQYIIGSWEFMGLELMVSPAVLIPRPETELVVEVALELIRDRDKADQGDYNLVDLGTGSGAIAISLAKEVSWIKVHAVDCSGAAVGVARSNARKHLVADRVKFYCGDLFNPLKAANLSQRIDLLVSNPPYISTGDLGGLPPEVRDYEPLQALDGGEDGLAFYRRIAAGLGHFLRPGGSVVLEVGQGQAQRVKNLLVKTGMFASVHLYDDLAGIKRVVAGRGGATVGG